MNTKTELQQRIEKCESELAALKSDLAKCDCASASDEEIEQEKCWHAVDNDGVCDVSGKTKAYAHAFSGNTRPAYMPECRQVEPEDARIAEELAFLYEGDTNEFAYELHKRGFRMKVNP